MKLNGTGRGKDQEAVMIDIHRQAKLFYGNDSYSLNIGEPYAHTDYEEYTDGSVAPTRTIFELGFEACPIQEEK